MNLKNRTNKELEEIINAANELLVSRPENLPIKRGVLKENIYESPGYFRLFDGIDGTSSESEIDSEITKVKEELYASKGAEFICHPNGFWYCEEEEIGGMDDKWAEKYLENIERIE